MKGTKNLIWGQIEIDIFQLFKEEKYMYYKVGVGEDVQGLIRLKCGNMEEG